MQKGDREGRCSQGNHVCEGTQAESSMIYAEEPTSVWLFKDKVGGDQQKSLIFFFYTSLPLWTNIRSWLKHLWIKF